MKSILDRVYVVDPTDRINFSQSIPSRWCYVGKSNQSLPSGSAKWTHGRVV